MTRHRRKSPLHRIWVPLFAILFVAYFAYHAQNGTYGLDSLKRLEAEAVTLKAQVDKLREERAAIEQKVAWLKPDSLDADVVAWLKQQGRGYQTRLNHMLRIAMVGDLHKNQTKLN